jgi:REP element-mobilizing transposase RayT
MPRKQRLEFPGAIYHIHHRGNHQEHIYLDDYDRKLFLKLLETTIQRMNWICHAYCLMGSHYHLLIEIPEGILSRGMAWLNGVYTQKLNKKYGLTGHLFQGRFKSKPIEDNMQFLMAARYIVRNPLGANIVENADQWQWSSYSETVGKIKPPEYLFVDDVLACLSSNRQKAQHFFQELVHVDLNENDDGIIHLFQKVYAEDREAVFKKRIRTLVDMKNSMGPVVRSQRIRSRHDLQELFNGTRKGDLITRNRIISDALKLYAYTQSEIADFLGLSSSAISKVICKKN